jgi:hypothetical protein
MECFVVSSCGLQILLFFPQDLISFIVGYLDPGTGSLVLQLLIAFGVGLIYFLKTNWKRLKAFLASHFSRNR